MLTYHAAIIGGGIIGSSLAWELARDSWRVVGVAGQQRGREAAWAAAGILSPAPESPAAFPMVPLGRASLALYPEFVAAIEEDSGENAGFQPKGTLQTLFARDAERELSTLMALHHGLGLAAEALRIEDARELEPALSGEVLAAALRPEEASVDNRALTRGAILAAQPAGVEFPSGQQRTRPLRARNRSTRVAAPGATAATTMRL